MPNEEAADARGIAEHLVEGDADEVGLDRPQIEPVGRHERGPVQQDVPPLLVRLPDQVQWVHDAGEIRLSGEGEEMRLRVVRAIEQRAETRAIDVQVRQGQRRVLDGCAVGACKLPNAVHRVVIVERQEEPPTGGERVGFPNQLERGRRIEREHSRVLGGRRVEVRQNRPSRLLDQARGRRGAQIARVGISKDVAVQQVGVMPELRFGVQAAPRVIEIHVPLRVETAVVRLTERIEDVRAGVLGIPSREIRRMRAPQSHSSGYLTNRKRPRSHESTKSRNTRPKTGPPRHHHSRG